ncbi:WD40 repeat-like protein [Rhizoclosmatium globosum]|uniref:WD40 repeat-like protein n=1 Tax=Rhizoclosmatium globosum TaxID=329046 RepID=A0A1Y2B2D3_9FUNG|nr:WD40 repeat-like protein [Rhizoclosmatium globosum]|eukprot:ORY28245.1 WD40 repeat-like protein [Rhizoclosmatium globosum]
MADAKPTSAQAPTPDTAGGKQAANLLVPAGAAAGKPLSTATSKSNIADPSTPGALSQQPSNANIAAAASPTDGAPPPLEKPPVGVAIAPGNTNPLPSEGILPLFLAGMTQDIFKIKGNEDVTREKPIKIIPKADLIADVMARRAVSDFQPYLDLIKNYPDDELLLYFDADFIYGQNFVLATTPAAVDAILRPPVIDAAVAEEQAMAALGIKKKPVSKPWECLGSDKDMSWSKCFRENIAAKAEFGKDCNFSDKETLNDPVMECKSFKDPAMNTTNLEQCIPDVETIGFRQTGFDPSTFLYNTDEVIDFVKTIADKYHIPIRVLSLMFLFISATGEEDLHFEKGTHAYLQEYQSFTDLQHSKDKSISCTDWHPTQKGIVAVSCVSRTTLDERIDAGFIVKSKQSLLLIWSFHDPIHPQLILEAPEDIYSFQFLPSDPNFIAGGCVNGQVVLWDISEHQDKLKATRKRSGADDGAGGGGESEAAASGAVAASATAGSNDEPVIPIVKYIIASSIEFSHRGAITDLQWLPGNMHIAHNGDVSENSDGLNHQLVTCSADGQVCVWDTRSKKVLKELDLAWKPFLRVPLSAMDNTFDYGLTKVTLKTLSDHLAEQPAKPKSQGKEGEEGAPKKDAKKDTGIIPISKFFTATEEGDLLFSDWVAEKSSEEKAASRVEHTYSMHFGPMSDLQRSPFFPDIILSSGGWSFHVWKERVNAGPLVSSPTSAGYIISGRWSPTRPGYISPATVQNVASVGISHMSIRQYPGKMGGQFVAAADDEGTLHILEKQLVRAFFDREVKRLGYVAERKQIRVKEKGPWEQAKIEAAQALRAQQAAIAAAEKKKEEGEAAGAAPAAEGEQVKSPQEEMMDKLEAEYRKFEHNFLEAEGLLPPKEEEEVAA